MTAEQNGTDMDLRQQLEKLQRELLSQAPPESAATMEKAAEELIRSGIAGLSRHEGEKAPDFTLPDATGEMVRLSECLARGPAVVTFYRGAW